MRGLKQKIQALFAGEPVNTSEKRPALHTALRDLRHPPMMVNGENVAALIRDNLAAMREFVQKVHDGALQGATGKPFRHIVNVGIGGSQSGPLLGIQALKEFAVADLRFHFLSTVDPAQFNDVVEQLDPETTLFIVSSKTFSTIETLTNAQLAVSWLTHALGAEAVRHHFVAVTAKADRAIAFGIAKENIFPMWDWVGGRYSIWSAIGLPIMLMIGAAQFDEFLTGAYELDQHVQTAPFHENMPVILALLGIWYINFFGASSHAIIPYSYRLRSFIPYLQQLDMESNGKSVDLAGKTVSYATGPVNFGLEGCEGQHTYHQLLHQGYPLIPSDLVLVNAAAACVAGHPHPHLLLASGLSQAQALMRGKTVDEAYHELSDTQGDSAETTFLAHSKAIPGNKPSNLLFLEQLNPKTLGALIALYEHKVFIQGAIWGINSFDQWGVELGKQLLPQILADMDYQRHVDTQHIT